MRLTLASAVEPRKNARSTLFICESSSAHSTDKERGKENNQPKSQCPPVFVTFHSIKPDREYERDIDH